MGHSSTYRYGPNIGSSYQNPVAYDSNNTRNTKHCSNTEKIKSNKEKYGNLCQASDSAGILSAHNCANRCGKSYLCVKCGKAHCLVSDLALLHEIAFQKHRIADVDAIDYQASESAGT